jgi:hypothetical protein
MRTSNPLQSYSERRESGLRRAGGPMSIMMMMMMMTMMWKDKLQVDACVEGGIRYATRINSATALTEHGTEEFGNK